MLLPNFIYGLHKAVKKRCEKLGKTVTSREDYLEKILSMGMRDTATDAGELLLVDGADQLMSKEMCYHLRYPLMMVWGEQPPGPVKYSLIGDIFEESIKTAWGTLLLTPRICSTYMRDNARCRAYIRAVFAHWDEINSVGPRYSLGLYDGKPLLEVDTMIQKAIVLFYGMTNEEAGRADWPALFHELRSKGDL
jgi:hypothetical protein